MSDLRGAVKFTAGGEDYALRFTTNAMVSYQEEFAETVVAAAEGLSEGGLDLRRVRGLLNAGMDPEPGLKRAGEIIDQLGMIAAAELVAKAIEAAFPKVEGSAEGNEKKASKKTQ